jgi:hypothetical protein
VTQESGNMFYRFYWSFHINLFEVIDMDNKYTHYSINEL